MGTATLALSVRALVTHADRLFESLSRHVNVVKQLMSFLLPNALQQVFISWHFGGDFENGNSGVGH